MNKEGPVQCDFEDAFLYDGERQLKIRFNPKVSSFKTTVLDSKKNVRKRHTSIKCLLAYF